MPYTSLMAVLTRDSRERSRMAAVKLVFAICGTLIAAAGTKPLVSLFETEIIGFRYIGLAYGAVAAIAVWITFLSVREPESLTISERFSAWRSLRFVVSNHPFLILASTTVLFQVAMTMMAAMASYYFKYVLGAESLISVAFICLFVTAIVCTPFFVRLSHRTSKMTAYVTGMGTMAVTLAVVYLIGKADAVIIIGTFTLCGAGISVTFLSPWAMIPDTVEYSEWKTGRRMEGILFGLFFFSWKLAAATSGLITGLGLELIGYVPNVEQSAGAIRGLTALLTIIPAGFIVIGILILRFYPINEEMFLKMISEINSRNNE